MLDRDELIGRRLRSLAEMLCEGSLTPLLTHLARANDLTDEDRLALRAIFDEPDPGSTSNVDHSKDIAASSLSERAGHRGRARRQWAGKYAAADDDHEHRAEVDLSWNRSYIPARQRPGSHRLAVVAAGVGRICRRPALTHSLWLIVLLKLVTPPLVPLSLPAPMPLCRPESSRDNCQALTRTDRARVDAC